MSNISKSAKKAKIREQKAKLLAQLLKLYNDNPQTIDDFISIRRPSARYEQKKQYFNIQKKIAFLNRKLEKLEAATP